MRKIIFFATVFFLFVCEYGFSQITFEKLYDYSNGLMHSYGTTVIADDNGYFLSGSYFENSTRSVLIRTNLSGDTLWTKTFPSGYGNIHLITKSSLEEYVFLGNPSNLKTKLDIRVTKMDGLGNIIWDNTIVKPNRDVPNQIIQTNDNGYLIAGQTNSLPGITTAYPYDAYIIKLNSNGDTLWTKTVGNRNYNDYAYSAIETSDSHYLVAGQGYEDNWNSKALLIKMDTYGNILWTKKYGNGRTNQAFSVAETQDNNYIIVGTEYPNTIKSTSDFYALKVDKNGNVIWEETYHFDGRSSGLKLLVLSSGFLIAGQNNEKAFLLKIGDAGNLLWSKTIMTLNAGSVSSIDKCNDGGFIFTTHFSLSLFKTDAEGRVKPNALSIIGESNVSINDNVEFKVSDVRGKTYTWKSSHGIISSGQGTNSIVISWDEVGLDSVKVFIENDCGIDSIAFNVNIQECVPLNVSKIQSLNSCEFYVDKYEGQNPTYLWSVDNGTILSGQNSNRIKVNWQVFGVAEVSVKVTNDCSEFEDNIKFIVSHLDNVIEGDGESVKIYPNPVKNELIIDNNGLIITKLEILNLSGKKISNHWLNDGLVNVSVLPQGVYFVKLETDGGVVIKKFVKE